MRYEEIFGWGDIIGGADGGKDKAGEAISFLGYWFNDGTDGNPKGMFIQLIDAIIKFFNDMAALF